MNLSVAEVAGCLILALQGVSSFFPRRTNAHINTNSSSASPIVWIESTIIGHWAKSMTISHLVSWSSCSALCPVLLYSCTLVRGPSREHCGGIWMAVFLFLFGCLPKYEYVACPIHRLLNSPCTCIRSFISSSINFPCHSIPALWEKKLLLILPHPSNLGGLSKMG